MTGNQDKSKQSTMEKVRYKSPDKREGFISEQEHNMKRGKWKKKKDGRTAVAASRWGDLMVRLKRGLVRDKE